MSTLQFKRPSQHMWHRFGDSWRCWLCPASASQPVPSHCRQRVEPSLSYVPKSRPCTLGDARQRAEEGW
jgi:hypothetical protein